MAILFYTASDVFFYLLFSSFSQACHHFSSFLPAEKRKNGCTEMALHFLSFWKRQWVNFLFLFFGMSTRTVQEEKLRIARDCIRVPS
ncbi:hypothetical protein BX661DRAFT_189710 [Kickxella alabastrina]|uniref:uncharacterized protein n=1 Tax=Kickxella alabastrina TaxID=61397 RepID=UPI00221E8B52|nr:uncharacterized protein BX661DRAFT_189710 [Kickxella alabastrina]KAI7819860.1 hypothetical protein BX661DRAFT_189710 [Kickxella alabastrina]